MHEVLVNHLGGLSLPRKSVVRLTDRPDMTLDVYRGRKTTTQNVNNNSCDSNKQCKAPTVFIAQRMTHQMCKMYGKNARHCRHVYKGGQLSSLPVCFLDPFKIGSTI